jgi:hypothetical protein
MRMPEDAAVFFSQLRLNLRSVCDDQRVNNNQARPVAAHLPISEDPSAELLVAKSQFPLWKKALGLGL